MKEETQGIIVQLENESKLEVSDFLLKSHSIEEIAFFIGMPFEDALLCQKV